MRFKEGSGATRFKEGSGVTKGGWSIEKDRKKRDQKKNRADNVYGRNESLYNHKSVPRNRPRLRMLSL